MGGLRVTLTRKHPLIFAMHPIPWRCALATDGSPALMDGAGRIIVCVRDAGAVAYWLYALYRYVVPLVLQAPHAYVTSPNSYMPSLLLRHPLPWEFLTLQHFPSEAINCEWTYELQDADGEHVVTWHRLDIVGALHDLSVLAEDKYFAHMAQERVNE